MDQLSSRPQSNVCRLMKPTGWVSSPSTNCINKSDPSLIWTSSSHITSSLSSLVWFVPLEAASLFFARVAGSRVFLGQNRMKFQSFSAALTNVDLGRFDHLWLMLLGQNTNFSRPHLLAQKSRSLGQFDQWWLQIWLQKITAMFLSPLTRFDRIIFGWLCLSWKAKLDLCWPSCMENVLGQLWPPLTF